MSVFLHSILFFVGALVAGLSACFFLCSFCTISLSRRAKQCTQWACATLVRITDADRDNAQCFELTYTCDGNTYVNRVPQDVVEGVSAHAPAGTPVTIWYDPDRPMRIIVAEDPFMEKTAQSWRRTRKRTLILMLIFGLLTAYAYPRSALAAQPRPAAVEARETIGAAQ